MKVKTSEATGVVLDWLVAKANGDSPDTLESYIDGLRCEGEGAYSTEWAQGGPIIERESIDVLRDPNGSAGWGARAYPQPLKPVWCYGATPLIAAMRCFVASKLGDEVDVPEELA